MAMSRQHKEALAQGRRESRAIKAYLEAVNTPKRRGRPVTADSLKKRIATLDSKLTAEEDPLKRVDLIQQKLDAETALDQVEQAADIDDLEAGFIKYARPYSERKHISYAAWRYAGVPAATLQAARIKRTRR